jgi:hypothetical protein
MEIQQPIPVSFLFSGLGDVTGFGHPPTPENVGNIQSFVLHFKEKLADLGNNKRYAQGGSSVSDARFSENAFRMNRRLPFGHLFAIRCQVVWPANSRLRLPELLTE